MADQDVASELQLALRRLAKAVVVLTSRHNGVRYAMAATAVSELSMDPPSMLICVNRAASLQVPLSAGASFCINILHRSHREIADLCSGAVKGEARFDKGAWEEGFNGVPVLRDAQAGIICSNDQQVEYGTHMIYIGRVLDVVRHSEVDPLVYVDGRYTAVEA